MYTRLFSENMTPPTSELFLYNFVLNCMAGGRRVIPLSLYMIYYSYQIIIFNSFICSPFCMDIYNFAYWNMLRFPPIRKTVIIVLFCQRCHAMQTSSLLKESHLPSNHLVIFIVLLQFLLDQTNNYQHRIIWSFFSIFFWLWQLLHHPWLKAWMKSRKVENLET